MAISIAASVVLGAALVSKWPAPGGRHRRAGRDRSPCRRAPGGRPRLAERGLACERACVGRHGRPKDPLSGLEHGLRRGLHTQLGTAARIGPCGARHAAAPRVPTLIAAELPILVTEGMLAALTSFTLVGPLGLPWWVPVAALAAVAGLVAALTRLGAAKARWLYRGLAVLRTLHESVPGSSYSCSSPCSPRSDGNWLLLRAVGIDASLFDAIAVLIAVVTLGQLPFGLSVGTAASVLILGPEGVTAAAAAGVLLTATGTVEASAAAWAAPRRWSAGCAP